MARILLIDDDDAVRGVLGEILTRAGHTVIEARDGDEGVALFSPAADLVITDMVMPRKGGREVMRLLRERQPLVRIIAMSGGERFGSGDVLGLTKLDGAAAVLTKPFTFHVLLTAINEVLQSGSAGTVDGPRREAGV